MIGPEPELETVFRDPAVRRGQARVVDENVDRSGERRNAPCAFADRGEVGEVERDEARHASEGPDRVENVSGSFCRATGQHRRRATSRELEGRGLADARIGPGDDEEASGEVLTVGAHGQERNRSTRLKIGDHAVMVRRGRLAHLEPHEPQGAAGHHAVDSHPRPARRKRVAEPLADRLNPGRFVSPATTTGSVSRPAACAKA